MKRKRFSYCLFLLAGTFVLFAACSDTKVAPDSNSYVRAADSAATSVWKPEQVDSVKHSLAHSAFYDSVRKLILPALSIEKEKRLWADSLSRTILLSQETLKNAMQRKQMLVHIALDSSKTRDWKHRVDSLFLRYTSFITRTADSLFSKSDSIGRRSFISGLLRYSYFQPSWRTEFDSIEQVTLEKQQAILLLIDTSKSEIHFDSLIRFEDPTEELIYNQLLEQLDTIAEREREFLKRAD